MKRILWSAVRGFLNLSYIIVSIRDVRHFDYCRVFQDGKVFTIKQALYFLRH
jgi:hypothetical protein